MRAGKLRERITIEVNTPAQDGYGEPVESWGTYAVRWASVEPVNGTERWSGSERLAEATHLFTVRHDAQTKLIGPGHRVYYDSRAFDIQTATNRRDRMIEIVAVEKL